MKKKLSLSQLQKPDSKFTLWSSTTGDLLIRIKKNHPLLFWCFAITFAIGLLLFLLKLYVTFDRYFLHIWEATSKAHKHDFYSEIEHIDIVGIFIGLAGIFFAVVIAIVIEEIKAFENEQLNARINELNKATSSTQKVARTILSKYTALEIKLSLNQQIDSVLDIIKLSKDTGNDLFILNFSANPGHIQSHNFKTVIEEGRKLYTNEKLQKLNPDKITIYDYHHWYRAIRGKKDSINEAIRELARRKNNKIRIAILNSSSSPDKPKANKYKRLLSRIFKEETILPYYKLDGVSSFPDFGDLPSHDIFTLPERIKENSEDNDRRNNLREIFVDYLLTRNLTEIESLTQAGAVIEFLDHVPFRFFASIPPEGSETDATVQKCLIEFTNIHSIGKPYGTIAFESQNPQIIQSLKNVFLNLTNHKSTSPPEAHDPNLIAFRKLFHLGKEVSFIIKSKDHSFPDEDAITYNPQVDISCAEGFKKMIWDQDKDNLDIYPITLNPQSAVVEVQKDTSERTFFCIGLFNNELTEWFSSDNFENRLFTMGHSNEPEAAKRQKFLKIKNHNGFKPVPSPTGPEDDFGLMFKITLAKNTIIIVGGATAIGTKQLGSFVINHWHQIYESADSTHKDLKVHGNNFVMFFKIHKEADQTEDTSKEDSYKVGILKDYIYVVPPSGE